MKAIVLFTGSAPLLILTSYESVTSRKFIEKVASKGIQKFVAYEIPEYLVKEKYGKHYDAVMADLQQSDDLRVLDWDGSRVINNFTFKSLGRPVLYEP